MDNKLVVGDNIKIKNAGWKFSSDVTKKFSNHVEKSVPLYLEGQDLICEISDYFIKDNSVCYDLGTSTGKVISKLAGRHQDKNVRWIGVEIEADMIEQAKIEFDLLDYDCSKIELVCDDIVTMDIEPCDFIVCYYTIQFIHPRFRQDVIDKIYKSLNWGGAFLLYEKVRAPDARFQDIATGLYNEYKLSKGYTSDEIISKTKSLKGVLEPFSSMGNIGLLQRAGFVDIMTIMKYVNFEGFFAIK